MAARTAASILATMSLGMFFGPITEYQLVTSKPLMPTSSNVGTSGRMDKRLGVEIAKGFNLPARICGNTGGKVSKFILI